MPLEEAVEVARTLESEAEGDLLDRDVHLLEAHAGILNHAVTDERAGRMPCIAHADGMEPVLGAESLQAGNPRHGNFALGSLVGVAAAERISGLVSDAVSKGAKHLAGGRVEGTVMSATVLDHVTPVMRLYGKESFGPVVRVVHATGMEEAVRIANDTRPVWRQGRDQRIHGVALDHH